MSAEPNRMQRFVSAISQASPPPVPPPPVAAPAPVPPQPKTTSPLDAIESKPHFAPVFVAVAVFVTLCAVAPPFVQNKKREGLSIPTVLVISAVCFAICFFAPQLSGLEIWNQLKSTE